MTDICEWGNTAKLIIAGKTVDVDSCITPMVKMFNDNGYETIASCCGHGKTNGNIALTDGRFIDIHTDRESWESQKERIKTLETWIKKHLIIATCPDVYCKKDCKKCPEVDKWFEQALKGINNEKMQTRKTYN